eukprot:XP_005630508.1 interleukin-36 gamma isoform X2 [Canis lupus familiaris]
MSTGRQISRSYWAKLAYGQISSRIRGAAWGWSFPPSVTITVLPCKYPELLEQGRGIPIYLGIENPEMCLICEDSGGQPTLLLKEEEILALYNEMAPVEPFLFYHSKNGRTSTFESVAFPGWFIASSERSHPIFLTSHQGGIYNVNFNLNINA